MPAATRRGFMLGSSALLASLLMPRAMTPAAAQTPLEDTGLGFKRWHQGKKLGLSQAALLGIAVCPELAPHGTWAKYLLDRSFELFDRWTERDRGLPPANAFSVPSIGDKALFPSWGPGARVSAVNARGERRGVTSGMSVSDVAWFHVESERRGC